MNENQVQNCPCKGVSIIVASLLIAHLYVLTRYVWLGPYGFNDYPLFLLNKILVFSAVLMLFVMSVIPFRYKVDRSIVGITTFYLIVFHMILGLILIPSDYFKEFFDANGTLKPAPGWALLFGVLAFVTAIVIQQGFYVKKSSNYPYTFFFRTGILVFFVATLLHIALVDQDFTHWDSQHKALIPVSVVSFGLLLLSFIIGMIRRMKSIKKSRG